MNHAILPEVVYNVRIRQDANNCSDDTPGECSAMAAYIGYMYVEPVLCFVSVVFNSLNVIVMTRKQFHMMRSMLILLVSLAFADLMASALALPSGPFRCIQITDNHAENYRRSLYKAYILLPVCNIFISSLTSL